MPGGARGRLKERSERKGEAVLERDYIMKIVALFAEAVRRSWLVSNKDEDPQGAAEMLEAAIGDATEIDGSVLLSLDPQSIAGILQVSGTDPSVVGYVARSLVLSSRYLHEAGQHDLANLREEQARALAEAYDVDLPDESHASELIVSEFEASVANTTL